MSNVDVITRNRHIQERHTVLLKQYTKQLSEFEHLLSQKRNENKKEDKFILNQADILKQADAVLDCLKSYKEIIPNNYMTGDLSCQIKTMEMVLPAIQLSKNLLQATTPDEANNASNALLQYAAEHLTAKQNWSSLGLGVSRILRGLLEATACLAIAGAFSMLVIAAPFSVGLAIFSGIIIGIAIELSLIAFGAGVYSGVNIMLDKDPNRDSLCVKVTDFSSSFFTHPKDGMLAYLSTIPSAPPLPYQPF